jgi:hypothetical protein
MLACLFSDAIVCADGDLPLRGSVEAGTRRSVALLGDLQPALAVVADPRCPQERHPGLGEEALEGSAQVRARRLAQRVEQVLVGGVAEGVTLHVRAHAVAEDLGPEPAFEHRQHAAALLIRDRVEGVRDVVIARDRLSDATRAGQAVGLHRVVDTAELRELRLVLGVHGVDRLRGGPGGERLVEPDVVPPGHRHEIPEPHVRQLVGHHVREGAALPLGCRVGVHEQQRLAEGDGADVLHGARLEVRHRDHVELGERIGAAKVGFERLE